MKVLSLILVLGLLPPAALAQQAQLKAHIETSGYPATDPGYPSHAQAKEDKVDEKGGYRIINYSDGAYELIPHDTEVGRVYKFGRLIELEFRYNSSNQVSSANYSYPSGQMLYYSVDKPNNVTELYKPGGELMCTWYENKCVTANGASCGSRSIRDINIDLHSY